jgi:hypothetical protein
MDIQLPASGLARVGVIAWLILGGIVALLVPVFLAIMVWGMLFGSPASPAP